MDVKVDHAIIGEGGKFDFAQVSPVLFSATPGGSTYFSLGKDIGKAFSIGKEIK